MATEIILPRLGQGMESGVIVRWLKAEGERVERGEPLYELDTEKVTQEVEADASGVLLRILAREGEEVVVGRTIAVIGELGEEVPPMLVGAAREEEPARAVVEAPAPAPESVLVPEPAPVLALSPVGEGARAKASPLARRIAKGRGIDLRSVSGTGPEGRIVAEDVERTAAAPAEARPLPAPAEVETVRLTSIRRTIARRLSEAWQAPHFAISMSADMRRVIELRERLVERAPEGAARPTYSDVLTKLCALALLRHPAMNAHYAVDEVRLFPTANISIAVAVPNGLIVPVIRSCEKLAVAEIAAVRADLVERARAGRLETADLEGGTFTISNLGMFGVERFVAVLNPPQVGILAAGAIEERPVVEDGAVVARPRMELTLSCDHRAVDGATAAEFLRTLTELLENPGLAL